MGQEAGDRNLQILARRVDFPVGSIETGKFKTEIFLSIYWPVFVFFFLFPSFLPCLVFVKASRALVIFAIRLFPQRVHLTSKT